MRRDLVIRRIGIDEPGLRPMTCWWRSPADDTSQNADCIACAAAAPAPVRVVRPCGAMAGAGRGVSARSQQQVAPPPEKPVGPPSCEVAGSRASIRQGRLIAPGAAAPREKTKAAMGATSLNVGLPAMQSHLRRGICRRAKAVARRMVQRVRRFGISQIEREAEGTRRYLGPPGRGGLRRGPHGGVRARRCSRLRHALRAMARPPVRLPGEGVRSRHGRRAVPDVVDADPRRSRRPEEPRPDAAPAGSTGSAEDSALAAERDRAVRSALAALPETQREVIELHRFEHLSFPEIAEALGEGVEAVKSRAFRGYKALRAMLTEMQP